jgi:hypothetical protein
MRAARSLAKLRYALIIPFALAALASTPAFARAEVIIQQAPPPARMEPLPAPRSGYAWDQGHWRWEGGGYGWVPGHWQQVRRNARWQPGHWVARGPNWYWIEGRWVR